MGLVSGQTGVKHTLSKRFPDAYNDFPDVVSARASVSDDPRRAFALLDGNVYMRLVPPTARSFRGFVDFFAAQVDKCFEAAHHVAIVFDEPENLTKAKAEEQARRAAAQRKRTPVVSPDVQAQLLGPTNDAYGQAELDACDPHNFFSEDQRAGRARFFDTLAVALIKRVSAQEIASRRHRVLVVDGVDARGMDRPHFERRVNTTISTREDVGSLLRREPSAPLVGEGDLKLTDICSCVCDLRADGVAFLDVDTFLLLTIDTDSLAIELLNHALLQRTADAANEADVVLPKTLLLFREKVGLQDAQKTVSFRTFDIQKLYEHVQYGMFGADNCDLVEQHHSHAIAMLVAGWALCGCDFVSKHIKKADVAWEAVCNTCRAPSAGEELSEFESVFSLTRRSSEGEVREARARLVRALERLLKRAGVDEARVDEENVKKAAWTTLYWSGLERFDLSEWGWRGPVTPATLGPITPADVETPPAIERLLCLGEVGAKRKTTSSANSSKPTGETGKRSKYFSTPALGRPVPALPLSSDSE